jgi:putative intracellular protease/amidase
MSTSPEFLKPLSWTSPDFSLTPYDLVFLVGGHDKAVRQIYDSPIIAKHLATYFPSTAKPSTKSVAAVCHGVLALAVAKLPDGKSVIHECKTATLPARFEQVAYWGTRLFLGDYYKTYGAGTEDVEVTVRKALDDPETQFKSSLGTGP